MIRAGPATPQAEPPVLGIDDWAWRRGHRYGTILVDLERNKVIDLLPDRQAETVADWLRRHPGVRIVARDRAGAYAEAIRKGAPEAIHACASAHHWARELAALGHTVRLMPATYVKGLRQTQQERCH